MRNYLKKIGYYFFLVPTVTFAAFTQRPSGFGAVANNLMEPVTIVSSLIDTGSIVIGISCLFAAFLRYMQYRVNPLATPISTVVYLLIFGVILTALPLLYMFTESGIPFGAAFK